MADSSSKSKKPYLIIGAVTLMAVGMTIVIISTQSDKTTEQNVNTRAENVNISTSKTNKKINAEETAIQEIESIIQVALEGTNNQGQAYNKFILVQRNYSEEEKYLATVRFNADENPAGLKASTQKKMAEILKTLYSTRYKFAWTILEAYTSQSDFLPIYGVQLAESKTKQVDWSQSVETLYQNILPSVWRVMDDRTNEINY